MILSDSTHDVGLMCPNRIVCVAASFLCMDTDRKEVLELGFWDLAGKRRSADDMATK